MRSVPSRALSPPLPEASIERLLHTACVKAGAGAALQVGLERLPLLKPFVPTALRDAGTRESAEDIQRRLIQSIYRRYGLKPAGWEIEGVLAVAQTQAVLTPLATREGLRALLRGWLPEQLSRPLMRYTPLAPLVTATVAAIAVTWAAGRYADSVCRLRKAGADWLPAPLAGALNMAPATLKAWSGEALALAMPPLKLAAALGQQLTGVAARAAAIVRAPIVPPARTSVARKAPVRKTVARKATKKAGAKRKS
jgi:hypothetical protein